MGDSFRTWDSIDQRALESANKSKVATTDNFKRRLAILEKVAELQKELRELD